MELEFRALVYEGWGKPGKTNCGKIVEVRVNLGETGMGRVFVTTHSCSVQSEKTKTTTKKICMYIYIYIYIYIYLFYEIFTDIKASRDEFPSLVSTLYRIRKVSKPWYFDFTADLKKNISTDDSIYYNHFPKRAMGRGEGWVEVPFVPPCFITLLHLTTFQRFLVYATQVTRALSVGWLANSELIVEPVLSGRFSDSRIFSSRALSLSPLFSGGLY